MNICSFNIKNDYGIYNKNKSVDIVDFIMKNDIDILCTQELFDICENDIVNELSGTNYRIFGKYRFKLGILRKINEKVGIITNCKVLFEKTYHLPNLPSLLKRVATVIVVDTSLFGKIAIINTHLDYQFDFVKKRQLKMIIKLVKSESLPVILMGDFNLKNNKKIFNDFVHELSLLGIDRVPINEKTLKQSRYNRAIDHIFVSNNMKVEDIRVIKDLEISDHYPILIKIDKM